MHICPEEIRLLLIAIDYVVNTYHYWVCGFKVRFLGAEKHDISEHYTDEE